MSVRSSYDDDTSSEPASALLPAREDTSTEAERRRCPIVHHFKFAEVSSLAFTVFYPVAVQETAAQPGVELSPETLNFVRDRDSLRQLAIRFAAEGFAGVKITPASASAFATLLRQLPAGAYLPRIAPDGDGALTVQWSFPDRSDILALIDDWMLHVIDAPATAEARHHPPVDVRNGMPPGLIRSLRRHRIV